MYDAIVVGARCAGSPTAMLLAHKGYRVLLVDRPTFPSDTMSTHFIRPSGVAQLKRWGLLGRVVASGCPPISKFRLDWAKSGSSAPRRRWMALPSRTRRVTRVKSVSSDDLDQHNTNVLCWTRTFVLQCGVHTVAAWQVDVSSVEG
ncbi:MAG: hypothetical protein E6I11_00155 [Chloroflexi bacterium]|nr:MAG: hypothetical protein E6I11_00155 [Chloroflexota bacterium]